MNYYNEDEKSDEGRPVIGKPVAAFKKLSPFGKTPAFSKVAGSVIERLKNLSKKDIAFVAVGLGVLVMAPVAEYMMSKPAGADQLAPGFGQRSEGGGSLYEPGINALSQGSPDGSGEVITPLSSRDPASLIIGSQSSQPPVVPQTPPKTDFRDSVKDSARAAFTEASNSAGAPTVIPRLQSALRSMGSFFSGGEGTRTASFLSGGKILDDAKNASGKAASRSMVGPVATAGYKGVASVPNSASKGAFEKLRSQADKAAGNFNGDSSITSLDKAVADSVDLGRGAGGLGGGAEGEKYRSPTGSSIRDNATHSDKESLAEKLAAERAEEALKWEFYQKYEIPKKIIEAMLGGFTGALTKFVQGSTEHALGIDDQPSQERFCWSPANDLSSTKPDDCKNGAIGESFLKDKGEKQSSTTIPPGRSCVCGFNSVKPTIGQPVNGAPAPSPAPNPDSTQIAAISSFDTALLSVVQRKLEVEKKGDSISAKDLLAYNKGISGTLAQGMPQLVGTLNTSLQGVDKLVAGDIAKLGDESLKSLNLLSTAESDTDKFLADIAEAIKHPTKLAKAQGAALTKASAINADLDTTSSGTVDTSFVAVLKGYQSSANNIKSVILDSAGKHLVFNDNSQELYSQQGKALGDKIGILRDKAADISKIVQKISDEANAISPEDADKNKDAICKQFADLSGTALPVCKGTAAPQKGGGVVDALMSLRGAKGVVNAALDDKDAVGIEVAAWKAANPKYKLDSDTIVTQSTKMDPPQENMAACLLRANNEMPPSVAGMVGNPETSVAGPARAASASILNYRKATGLDGSSGNTPAPITPVDPGSGAGSAALESARNVALQAHEAALGSMERQKDRAEKDVNSLSAMTDNQRAQDAVSSYNEQIGSIDTQMSALKDKIAGAKDEGLIKEYSTQIKDLKKDAAAATTALVKEYTEIAGKPSNPGNVPIPVNPPVNPSPAPQPGQPSAARGQLERDQMMLLSYNTDIGNALDKARAASAAFDAAKKSLDDCQFWCGGKQKAFENASDDSRAKTAELESVRNICVRELGKMGDAKYQAEVGKCK